MKRCILYPLISYTLMTIILASCDVLGDLIDFSFTTGYEQIPFSVNPSAAGQYTFIEKIMQSDIEAEVEENGGNIANLKDITIQEAKLEMLTPGQSLDAFEWVEVYIETDNYDEILVGSVRNISNGLLIVDLVLTEESLKDILEEQEYTVRVVGYLSEEVTTTLDLIVKIKYKVEVAS